MAHDSPSSAEPRPGQSCGVQVSCLTAVAELLALREPWQALADRSPAATVFQSWEWVTTWYQHFRADAALRVFVVRDQEGQLVGIVPCLLVRHWYGIRELALLGPDHELTEYMDALCAPTWEAVVAEQVFAAWQRRQHEWDLLVFPTIRDPSPFTKRVFSLAAEHGYARAVLWTDHGLQRPLPADWQALYSSLSRSARVNIRKLENRLRKKGYAAELEVVDSVAGLDQALQRFLQTHRLRAALRLDTRRRHDDYFTLPNRRAFLRSVAPLLAQCGHFWVGLLKVEGEVVAVQLWLSYRGVLSKWYSGYDPAWSFYGVMTLLACRSLERAMAHGATELDHFRGITLDRLRWGGERYRLTGEVLAPPSARAHLGLIVQLGEHVHWPRARQRLGRVRWLRRVRDRYYSWRTPG